MNYNTTKSKKTTTDKKYLIKPTDKKLKTILLSKIHKINNHESKAKRAFSCGNFMEFYVYPNNERKLKFANFCKARLCPMCNWRLSAKRFSNLSRVINELKRIDNYQLLFLTLTVKNCSGDALHQEIKKQLRAWSYLTDNNSMFKKSIKGWFRALEVTPNTERDDYHPHLHIVLAVKPHYFKTGYYIPQQTWTDIWQSVLKLDYKPIVHICKEYRSKKRNGESTLISEASKYATKDTDYIIPKDLNLSAKIVEVLDRALRSVRLIAYGGILKEIKEKLKLDEVNYADSIINKDLNSIIERYRWNIGLGKFQPFNPQQKVSSNEPNETNK